MTFNYREQFRENNSALHSETDNYKCQDAQKQVLRANNQPNTIVVSFIYPPDKKPDLEESKIVHILKPVIRENPLETPPRVYGHKFYLSMSIKPDRHEIYRIRQLMIAAYPDCKVFVKPDQVTQRDRQTIYLGRLLGVTKEMLEQHIRDKLGLEFKEVRVVRDKETGKPRNFGYVEFFHEDAARRAAREMAGAKLGLSDGLKAVMMIDE